MNYNLFIGRYGRCINFDSLDGLKEELSRYFTPGERHIAGNLCSFPKDMPKGSACIKNSWRDFEVTAFPD